MEGSEIVSGEGYAVAPDLDSVGEGYGFRKLRKELGLTGFGANVIVMPPGYAAPLHFHDEQEELYFVHRGAIEITFGDGSKQPIGEGGAARVDASTLRGVRNTSDSEDAVYLAIGGKGGYVGRDGHTPEEPES
jgi:mannose-6-phosphate isomerase-like protein (cupin superfamily)